MFIMLIFTTWVRNLSPFFLIGFLGVHHIMIVKATQSVNADKHTLVKLISCNRVKKITISLNALAE